MKSADRSLFLRQGSQVLGLIGTLLVLTFLLDFGIRLFAAQFENMTWQQSFLNELMDRGVTPLMGLTFIFIGTLLNTSVPSTTGPTRSLIQDGRFWLFVVASLFGLLYFALIPLHFGATGKILSDTTSQFDQEEARAQQEIQSQQAQLKTLASSGELDKLLSSEQIPQEQKDLFTQVKQDPSIIDKRAQEELAKIKAQKETALQKAKSEATLARLRAEIRSALLAIAFAILGWTGLRNVLRD